MAKLSPFPPSQILDDDTDTLSGGFVYTYEAGTSTPKESYTASAGDVAHSNPIVIPADGRVQLWLGEGAYKIRIEDSSNNLIDERDNIVGDSSLSFLGNYSELNANTTINTAYQNNFINVTAAATLALLASADAGEGFSLAVRNTSAGDVILDPDGAETIDGDSSLTLKPDQWAVLLNTGSEWQVLEKSRIPTNIAVCGDTGSANDYELSAISVSNPESYTNGLTVIFKPATNSTGASTITVGTLDPVDLTLPDGTVITNQLRTTDYVIATYVTANDRFEVVASARQVGVKYINGLVPSNAADADHDLSFTTGKAESADGTTDITVSTALTKRADASWVAGNNNGGLSSSLTLSNNTTYHAFAVIVGGSADILFDSDIDCTNGIADHSVTAYRRIYSFFTDGSANIAEEFTALETAGGGLDVIYDSPPVDVNVSNLGTGATLYALSVPLGLYVDADLMVGAADTQGDTIYVSSPLRDSESVVKGLTSGVWRVTIDTTNGTNFSRQKFVTNTSGQIRAVADASSSYFGVRTMGYADSRV